MNVPPYIDPTERGSYDTDELDALEGGGTHGACGAARYVVQTVSGYQINMPMGRRGSREAPGTHSHLTAHVCDSLELYRVVRSFRSEDLCRGGLHVGKRLAPQAALAAASELAAELNEVDRDTA